MSESISIDDLKVKYYMTTNPIAVNSNVNFPGGIAVMTIKSIGNLVVKQNRRPIGILTEREIMECLANEKKIPNKVLSKIVLQPFFTVHPNTRILYAASTMIRKKGRILVFDQKAEADDDHNENNNNYEQHTTKDDDGNNTISYHHRQQLHYNKKNENEKLVGIITASDMVRAFSKTAANPSLESIMTRRVFSIDFDGRISSAIDIMSKKRIGSVIVNKGGMPYGIFTERDVLTRVLPEEVGLHQKVGDYCTKELITGDIGHMGISAADAVDTMRITKIKRLPLRRDHKIVGIVTARDLVELYLRQSL
jgi:CBS domain-containing protein